MNKAYFYWNANGQRASVSYGDSIVTHGLNLTREDLMIIDLDFYLGVVFSKNFDETLEKSGSIEYLTDLNKYEFFKSIVYDLSDKNMKLRIFNRSRAEFQPSTWVKSKKNKGRKK